MEQVSIERMAQEQFRENILDTKIKTEEKPRGVFLCYELLQANTMLPCIVHALVGLDVFVMA